MTMPRYRHHFEMPVAGIFDSDYADFDEALDDLLPGCSPKETLKHLIDHCDCDYSIQNLEPTDMPNNPEVIK